MDRMHCDIVKDLLPLYVDDVCSEKSKIAIEEHLEECEECRSYFEILKEEDPKVQTDWTSSNFLEGEFIQGIEKKIKKKITFDMVVAGFMVFLVCTIGSIIYSNYPHEPGFGFYGLIDKRLDIEDVTITDVYRLKSGEIFFTAKSDRKFTWPYTDTVLHDGEKNIHYSQGMYTYSWWDDYVEGNGTLKEASFIYSPIAKDVTGHSYEVSEIRFVGKDDNSILVWEKGQELESAPKEIEDEVKKLYTYSEEDRGGICIFTESALETFE